MKISNFLVKLRSLSHRQKLIIMWLVGMAMVLALGYVWLGATTINLSKMGESLQALNFPSLGLPPDAKNTMSNLSEVSTDVFENNSQTEDWKTYTNTEYGFYFKYPNDWIVRENIEGNIVFISPETDRFNKQNKIDCKDENDATVCDPENIGVNIVLNLNYVAFHPYSEKDAVFNGTHFVEYREQGLYGEVHYRIMKEKIVIDFAFYNNQFLEPILSSFKFTSLRAAAKQSRLPRRLQDPRSDDRNTSN